MRLAPIGSIVERSMTLARNPVLSLEDISAVYLDQNPDTARPNTPMVINDSAAFGRLAANELVKDGSTALSDIPLLCGYDSRNFFMRMFKRKSGITMRDWRKTTYDRNCATQSPNG